jgi:ABC-type uncharacterized transport system auxiliary subunit
MYAMKILTALIMSLALAASLIACGGKSKKTDTTTTDPAQPTTTEGTGGATYGTPAAAPAQPDAPAPSAGGQ